MYTQRTSTIIGSTLIELLLSMSLAVTLTGFLLQIYLASHHSRSMQSALITIQDNANMATEILRTAIKKAGYIGCAKLAPQFPLQEVGEFPFTANNKISGSSLDITVRHMSSVNAELASAAMNSQIIELNNAIKFNTGDVIIISDCQHAELARVEKSSSGINPKLMLTKPLHFVYQAHAEVGHYEVNRYFVSATDRKNRDGSVLHALFVEDIHHSKYELVAGVERLNFHYYVLQAGQLIEVAPNAIDDWSQVRSVSIEMLLSSSPLKKIGYTYVAL